MPSKRDRRAGSLTMGSASPHLPSAPAEAVTPAPSGGEGGQGHDELWFALSAGGFVVGGILAGVLLFGGLYVLYQGFQGLR